MGDNTTSLIRRSLQRVAERLRARAGNGDGQGVATHVLLVVADELEQEALGKKVKE